MLQHLAGEVVAMVMTNCRNADFFELLGNNTNYGSRVDNFRFNVEQLFGRTDFTGKSFLDIGGGSGLFSFYAAYRGAKRVVCLEPEVEGSSTGMNLEFNNLRDILKLENVELIQKTIQTYKPVHGGYDIVLLNNSINHLNEECCINLHNSEPAWNAYVDIFKKISELANSHAVLFICDCSKYNIFPLLGLKNPFTPAIEWHKHQSPVLWSKLLSDSGFNNVKITWNAFNSFKGIGKYLLGNKCGSFFLGSRFTIQATKTG